MRILITGGTGYLGGRIAHYLSGDPDIKLTLATRNQTYEANENITIKKLDWSSMESLVGICESVDVIVHLAGMNAIECATDPGKALLVNAVNTSQLIQAAVQSNVKRILYFSTAHVYSSPLLGHIAESSCADNPHPYASSHKAAEDVVRYYNQQKKIEGVIVRLSNAFGAPVDINANCWMLLVNDLCRQAVLNRKLVLKTNGCQVRDFIPIIDVCRAVEHLVLLDKNKLKNGVFNAGGKNSMQIIEMAERISRCCLELLGYQPEIERVKQNDADTPGELIYDISSLEGTGFMLQGNIDAEIIDTLLLCRKGMTS